jgi:hypothetical protein
LTGAKLLEFLSELRAVQLALPLPLYPSPPVFGPGVLFVVCRRRLQLLEVRSQLQFSLASSPRVGDPSVALLFSHLHVRILGANLGKSCLHLVQAGQPLLE